MPHVAGLRGVVPETSKLAEVIATPPELIQGLVTGALVRDPGRAIYRYHQTFAGPGGRPFTRKSFFCAVRLSPWSEGMIRPHEATTPALVQAELDRIRANGGHTEPILAGVRDAASEVDRLFRKIEGGRATFELTTPNGCVHRLWRAQDAELIGKLRTYFTPKKLHLLEGHARYEAMLAYQAELAAKQELAMYSSANYGLACIVPMDDPALVPAARHKIIRGVTTKSADALAAVKKYFIVETLAGAATDATKLLTAVYGETVAHQPALVAVFAGEADAYKLTLSPDISPITEGVAVDRAIAKLDPVVIEHLFLAKALPGAQVTTDLDATRALAALGQGGNVAVLARPLSVEQIAHVDEIGQLLPAQSTAFFPPIARGIVSFVVDPDEDVV